jgi:hypothetical protein
VHARAKETLSQYKNETIPVEHRLEMLDKCASYLQELAIQFCDQGLYKYLGTVFDGLERVIRCHDQLKKRVGTGDRDIEFLDATPETKEQLRARILGDRVARLPN